MLILGLLLLLAVAAIVTVMVLAGGNTVLISSGGLPVEAETTALMIFLLGAATLLLLVLAFACMRAGFRRSSAKRQELRRLRRLDSGPTPVAPTPEPSPPAETHKPHRTGHGNDSPYGPGSRPV